VEGRDGLPLLVHCFIEGCFSKEHLWLYRSVLSFKRRSHTGHLTRESVAGVSMLFPS
jgi:hypothetical protein